MSEERKLHCLPDVSIPPPYPPPGLGTVCYPFGSDNLNFETPVAIQYKKISLDRKKSELSYFHNNKVSNAEHIRKTNASIARYCDICSESTSVIHPNGQVFFHSHTSSKTYRMNAPTDKWGSYPCFTCERTPHSHKIGMRYPIIVSSSILNHWQGRRSANLYPGDDMHIDYITIPGATIKDLHHAFISEFSGVYRPVDVLLVGGVNDVLQGRTAEQVLSDILNFKKSVLSLNQDPGSGHLSSFAVATVPFPPMMTVMPGESRRIYNNKLLIMVDLTTGIREMNRNGVNPITGLPLGEYNTPTFHIWGREGGAEDKLIGPRNLLETISDVRDKEWREDNHDRMLHLSDKARIRMGRSCIKYFKVLYGVIICYAPSKNAGRVIERMMKGSNVNLLERQTGVSYRMGRRRR